MFKVTLMGSGEGVSATEGFYGKRGAFILAAWIDMKRGNPR